MRENIEGERSNSKANKLCYTLTGSTNSHFALHLWKLLTTKSCFFFFLHGARTEPRTHLWTGLSLQRLELMLASTLWSPTWSLGSEETMCLFTHVCACACVTPCVSGTHNWSFFSQCGRQQRVGTVITADRLLVRWCGLLLDVSVCVFNIAVLWLYFLNVMWFMWKCNHRISSPGLAPL